MQHYHLPHLSDSKAIVAVTATSTPLSTAELKRGKKRGNYNCGRCGLPKKGHSCQGVTATPTDSSTSDPTSVSAPSFSASRPPTSRQPFSHLRRALSFDETDDLRGGFQSEEADDPGDVGVPFQDAELDPVSGGLPATCWWEVLKRLPPPALLAVARVCKGWRETAKKLWRAAEVLRLRVPATAQIGLVASVLQKCPGLVSLSLRMERLGFLIGLSRSRALLGGFIRSY